MTVTRVVPQATLLEATDAAVLAATSDEDAATLDAATEAELAPPREDAGSLVPSRATAVKLEKPCATMT